MINNGLIDSFVDYYPPTKQQVLLFDALIFPRFHLDDQVASVEGFLALERLREEGIVRCVTLTEDETEPWLGYNRDRDLWLPFPRDKWQQPQDAVRALRGALAERFGIDSVPVTRHLHDWSYLKTTPGTTPSVDVVAITLSTMPTPSDDVSWDAILEFRSDPESRHKLLGLRRWMASVAVGSRSEVEIREELEYLLGEYRRHLELHRMKWQVSTLESVLSLGAEALEGIMRLSPTRLVSALFAVRHRRISLLEAERSAPGREFAYLVDASSVLNSAHS